jgi:muramoyltetrapeptide carboxypeptidase
LLQAIRNTVSGWDIPLEGESMQSGTAEGSLLGGCLTILQATIGTPWQLDTFGAILVLEDTGMKPYQVDRALRHLLQAEQFRNVRGFLIGDFPNCDPSAPGGPTVREVCERILSPLGVPIVYGAPIGHTRRAMLTLPLGVRAKLNATGEGTLQILEPAVVE